MHTHAEVFEPDRTTYPVDVMVEPAIDGRNRLTVAFRFFLALPHFILVGGPVAVVSSVGWTMGDSWNFGFGSGGVLSVAVGIAAIIAWFAILITGRHPDALWRFAAFYLRWRVRAIAYATLLRDEYPPFGTGEYPVELALTVPETPRDRLTVAFRAILAIPHIIALCFLSLVWAFTTALAWAIILVTGRYPETLYGFAIGVLSWSMRVEAYMFLMRDEYPPFTLRV